MTELILGINGLGRVGKLTLWTQIARKEFSEIVVNVGREVGGSFDEIISYIRKDSTYGRLDTYLFGAASRKEAEISSDETKSLIIIEGIRIYIRKQDRNPRDIDWGGAHLVIDTTGKFNCPNHPSHYHTGSARGHLEHSSVRKVVISSPFKFYGDDKVPDDSTMVVLGVNDHDYDRKKHHIISNASCTTTCLAHMLGPLVQYFGPGALKSFSMDTVHAATGKQTVLDCVPAVGETDPCKSRSVLNNIFLTTTGAAGALKYILPEIADVPFIAQSIRVPTITGSLVVLTVDVEPSNLTDPTKENINNLFRHIAEKDPKGYLRYSETRNVSSDIIGAPFAAAMIEGAQTQVVKVGEAILPHGIFKQKIRLFGWYDNELGSYVNMLADHISVVADSIR